MTSKQEEHLHENKEEEEVDEEDDEQDDEEEEYAEAEPVLTYSRMKNDINEILLHDSVSCIKAGHKVRLFCLLLLPF